MNIKETARSLSIITQEQWEAILTLSKQNINFGDTIKLITESKEDKLENILNLIEISHNSKGYNYLKDAVLMYMENSNLKIKEILFQLAQKHNTTPTAIRSAIDRELGKANVREITKMGLKTNITLSKIIAIIAKL